MAKITYTDKVDSITNPLPAINKVVSADLNEIKTSVNALYDGQDTQDEAIALNTAKVSFPEAPSDGTPYARQDAGWVASSSGSAQVQALLDSTGWMRYLDTVNNEGNKQTLTAAIDNDLTIVDASPLEAFKPVALGTGDLWAGNKITPMAIGDTYLLRIDFTAEISNVSGYCELKIDIGGAIGDIISRTITFPKGANVAQKFSVAFSVYTLDTFFANGGSIQINPSHTMLIWDKILQIERIYAGDIRG